MPEEQILSELSVDRVRAHVEHITREIPSRLAGSENSARMARYSHEKLREAGLLATLYELPGLVSFPGPAELRVLSPEERAIAANTLGHSLTTLPEGISGELVYVASGSFEDYEGKDVRGKITLSELSYSPARHEKQRLAGMKGSIAQIMMNWGHPENPALPFGSVKPVWGNPTPETAKTEMPTIPCIGITRPAGLYLKELCERGTVRVWLRADAENVWKTLNVTTGEISVPTSGDFVVAGGHQDSWPGPQATDNAAGDACLMELARVFAGHRDELRRGLLFGFWMGHETGTMVGSSWYVDQNWDRIREHAVAYLQIDQPACVGTSRWGSGSNAELRRFHQAVERRLLGNRPFYWRRAHKTGDSSFFGIGVPMFAGSTAYTEEELRATALATLGWWHHSLENTIEKLDWDLMNIHLKIYGAYLWDLCTSPILPFEFISVAEQFRDRLKELESAGRTVGLSGAVERTNALREAAVKLDEVAQMWQARYRSGEVKDEEPGELLNTCMKRLSRLLVPLASTTRGTYGHDPYGYTPQTTMIPSLFDVPTLAKLPEGEERWQLETHLIRERNRVADTLGDA
ncbi:MAG: M28 family peptidase, partial [Candidatus Tectomicrobia bacterium]|nr:M28 family peptidase [Candidatus Tectomicrobia bacterium]